MTIFFYFICKELGTQELLILLILLQAYNNTSPSYLLRSNINSVLKPSTWNSPCEKRWSYWDGVIITVSNTSFITGLGILNSFRIIL